MAFSIKKQEKTQTEMKAAEERQKERDLESLEEYEKRQNGAEEWLIAGVLGGVPLGVSAGCAVWLNYADFAGVKCDVRFGLYL